MLTHGIRREMGQPQKVAFFFFLFFFLPFFPFPFFFYFPFSLMVGGAGRKGVVVEMGRWKGKKYVTQAVSRNRKPDADRWEVLRDGRS